LGHIWNVEYFVIARDSKYKPSANTSTEQDLLSGLLSTLSLLSSKENNTYINPIMVNDPVAIFETLKIAAGITGVLMVMTLGILLSTSLEYIRRSFYNLFWYMHQIIAILFFIMFCVHGIQRVIRKQTDLEENDPQKCYLIYSEWPSIQRKCSIPKFSGSSPSSWIWVLPSILIYIFERLLRFFRGLRQHKIVNHIFHASNVLELQIETFSKEINYRAGQYIFLNSNKLAFFEWHPFTITSSPNDKYLSVHIRCSGDWTSNLEKNLKENNSNNINSLSIDGPYGTCAEDVFKYEIVILIGAGIGVTPYASILKDIWHKLKSKQVINLRKVYFYWICSTIDSFEWFGHLLQDLERKSLMQNFLEYKIYLTRGWSLRDARQIAINNQESHDLYTGLQQKTNYGRPNFDLFFKDLADKQPPTEQQTTKLIYGVFFCGPKQLSKDLHQICNRYSNNRIKFVYNKENF
jgi:predicted ferric reductase